MVFFYYNHKFTAYIEQCWLDHDCGLGQAKKLGLIPKQSTTTSIDYESSNRERERETYLDRQKKWTYRADIQ